MSLKEHFIDLLQPLFLVLFAVLGLALGDALLYPADPHERTGTVEIHALGPMPTSAP